MEEEKKESAGGDAKDFAVALIKTLHMGIANMRLYPPGSEIVKQAAKKVYESLSQWLADNDSLMLSESKGKFLMDGKEVDAKSAGQNILVDFAFNLADMGIKSIEFRRGLREDEAGIFLQGMSAKKQGVQEKGWFARYLGEKGVNHILINEVVYVALSRDEDVLRMPDIRAGEDIESVMAAVEKGAEMISSLSDKTSRQEAVKSLARKIASLDPEVLREFLARPMPSNVQLVGIRESVLKALSAPKVGEIFEKIADWYNKIISRVPPDKDIEEQVSRLRQFLDVVLTAPEAKSVPPYVFERLLKSGALEKLPPWVPQDVEKEGDIIQKIVQGESSVVLQENVRDKIPGIVRGLCISDQDEMAGNIMSKITKNLAVDSPQARTQAAKLLGEVVEVVWTSGKDDLLSSVVPTLLNSIKGEKDIGTFTEISKTLRKRVPQLLMKGQYDYAAQTTAIFKIYSSLEGGVSEEKKGIVGDILKEIATESIPVLLSDLKSGDPVRQSRAVPMLRELGETVIAPLIETIEEFDDFRVGKMCATILKGIGDKAREQVINELRTNPSVEPLKRLIGVLEEMGGGEDMLDYLGELVHHKDAGIRVKAARLLGKSEGPAAEKVMLDLLFNPEPSICQEAIRFFANRKSEKAVERLIKLLRSRDEVTVKEACIVLGEMENKKAVAAMGKIINPGFFGKKRGQQVRVAAALALRKFPGKQTETIFTQAAWDKSPIIQRVARESLEYLRGVKK